MGKSALVRRRSWHRKMKIASTSSAWMVRPNPRKNQTKENVKFILVLLMVLLLVVVIPRLHCYVHPQLALVRRRSWHRKMKIASTSSAWMVRPNPRKKTIKKKKKEKTNTNG